jgi:hypothetical protein
MWNGVVGQTDRQTDRKKMEEKNNKGRKEESA